LYFQIKLIFHLMDDKTFVKITQNKPLSNILTANQNTSLVYFFSHTLVASSGVSNTLALTQNTLEIPWHQPRTP